MDYVIIGNSTAAVGCIEGIRQVDETGPITVVSKEKYHTYSRPLVSYLLSGKTDEERMKYRPDGFYREMGCSLLAGKTAVKIEHSEKKVLLDDGKALHYDRLLVATGSDPFIPPVEGLDTVEKWFTFMSLEDAKAIKQAVSGNTRVLIMGAGLIGLKCAEGLAKAAGSITVIDLADRILPSILDGESSAIVRGHLEKQGMEFILSDRVEAFEKNTAFLKSGMRIEFDVLIVAVGVRPNTQLVREAGGEVNRGIVTDRYCRTSLPDIYAAGDCAESYDIAAGENRVLALLPNAYMQGECAGINMAGGEKLYDRAIPMNSIGFFGLHIITAGIYTGTEHVFRDVESTGYKKLVTGDGLLKGYILVGDVARSGIYTGLIREQTSLDSIDFELIKEKPQLLAFSRVDREKMLGGR